MFSFLLGVLELPVILPLASDGGCQLMLMVRGRPSLLTTVTSLGADVGTEEIKICNYNSSSGKTSVV